MHIWVFGAAALTAPETAGRYHGQLHELSLLLSGSESGSVCLFMAQHSPLEPEALARRDEGS
jgi:hypothetical protein